MYAKVFQQIYDSSIVENPEVRFTFMDLLVLADSKGIVDMTHEAIARRTNRPIEVIRATIEALEKPDLRSRSPDENGSRLVRLDDHRDWGWRIVNYSHYREMRSDVDRKEYRRQWMRDARKADVVNRIVHRSSRVNGDPSASACTPFGKYENLLFGSVPPDLVALASSLEPLATAPEWHDYVEAQVKTLGYFVRREVPCDLGDGRTGRIDLVAKKGAFEIAIELDWRTPRSKSIEKVKTYHSGMVLLREPKLLSSPQTQALQVYDAYPKKVGRPDALRAIAKALTKYGFERVLERTRAYAKARAGHDPKFTPYPATFFNQERFMDDPSTWAEVGFRKPPPPPPQPRLF